MGIQYWHADMRRVLGRLCIFFINDMTLFFLPVIGVKDTDFRNLGDVFLRCLVEELTYMGIEGSQLTKVNHLLHPARIGGGVNAEVFDRLRMRIEMTESEAEDFIVMSDPTYTMSGKDEWTGLSAEEKILTFCRGINMMAYEQILINNGFPRNIMRTLVESL